MQQTVARPLSLDVEGEIRASLESFFDRQLARAAVHGGQYPALWREARQASRGGKKLRPALVVNVFQELGGIGRQHAVAAATAFELLHTAFLMHDDVIDRDTVRRGQLNIVGSFAEFASERGATEADALLWGHASAILAGDLLIQAAQSILARLPINEHQRLALLDLFDHCVFVTAAGELADVAFATGTVTPVMSEVLAMAEHKTAAYSFEGPLLAAGILANATAADMNALGEFGRLVGMAFQLRDDVLGIFGDEEVTGKSVISDLRAGKITPMVAFAMHGSDSDELHRIMGQPELVDADGELVRALLERCGARAYVEDLMVSKVHQAIEVLEASTLPASLQLMLREVAGRATERRR